LKDVLKIAFLSATVELIWHLGLSNVLRKELPQINSSFSVLKGSQIVANCSYVPDFFVCHILIMVDRSASIVADGLWSIHRCSLAKAFVASAGDDPFNFTQQW